MVQEAKPGSPERAKARRMLVPRPRTQAQLEAAKARAKQRSESGEEKVDQLERSNAAYKSVGRLMLKLQEKLVRVEAEKQTAQSAVVKLQDTLRGNRQLLARLLRERTHPPAAQQEQVENLQAQLAQATERLQQLLDTQDELMIVLEAVRLEGRQAAKRQQSLEEELENCRLRNHDLQARLDAELQAHHQTRHRLRGIRHNLVHSLMERHQERLEQGVAQAEREVRLEQLRQQLAAGRAQSS